MARIAIEYSLPAFSHLVVGSLLISILYYVHWQLTVGSSRRRLIKENGCQPITNKAELNSSLSSLVGWKFFKEEIDAFKSHRLLENSRQRLARNGNTFHVRLLLDDIIVTIEPDNVKTVMATKFKDFELSTRRKTAFLPLLGPGIFTTDGAAWQHSRDLLRPNFVRSQVGDLTTFETHVSHLIQEIPRDGSTVDLGELFFRLTIDSATEFLFGESTNLLAPGTSSKPSSDFAEAWNRAQDHVGEGARTGTLGTLMMRNRGHFKKDVQYIHEFVDRYVRRGLASRRGLDVEKAANEREGRYVFLDELVKSTSDPAQIRSELLNILLAGRDTTASLLTNVWFIIARRPDIWNRLQAEIEVLGGVPPTFTQIKEMKYLRWVLNESLRLHPLVPGNARMAVTDTVIPVGGGPDGKSPVFVAKGKLVRWSLYAMHRRKDIYGADAEDFMPERWEKLRPGWEYLPFNGGPRICLGQQFALTEASYTTIRLLQEFKGIESRDSSPWIESLTLTCVGRNGAQVALTPA